MVIIRAATHLVNVQVIRRNHPFLEAKA